MTLQIKYTKGFVHSKDGTIIGYRQFGHGPALVLVHGGIMASQNFMKLGAALSDEFTVCIPDRRGRGLSGSYGNDFSLEKEGEDMQALIHKTGAQNIFGLSSGAVVTLQTAIMEPLLKKVALYEPPLIVPGTNPTSWVDKYERNMAKGNLGAALLSIAKGTGDSSVLTFLPQFFTIPLINKAINVQFKKVTGDVVPLKALIPTMHYDTIIVNDAIGILEKCRDLHADLFLLGGEKSQPYLKMALEAIRKVVPRAKCTEFRGVGHLAADNGGKPGLVAKELIVFFKH